MSTLLQQSREGFLDMRKVLDAFYAMCMAIAAGGMICILLAVTAQIFGRLAGILVPSAPEIAGYSMAASSFMALAYTFKRGGHIRVSLLVNNLGERHRLTAEVAVLIVASALAAFFFGYMSLMTVDTYELNDLSPGVLPIPLWIPQAFITFGALAFLVAIVDELVQALRGRMPSYDTGEELDH